MKRLAALLRRIADRLDPTPLQQAQKIVDEYLARAALRASLENVDELPAVLTSRRPFKPRLIKPGG